MKKFFNVKTVSLILAVILLVGGAVGGTLAWIIDSKTVTNTFTYGDINVKLDETQVDSQGNPVDENGNLIADPSDSENLYRAPEGNEYAMVPGNSYLKDPAVTVLKGSEACYLFVELKEQGSVTVDGKTYTFDDYLEYAVINEWTPLAGVENVYYRTCSADLVKDNDVRFSILVNDEITVKGETVTKAMLTALDVTGNVAPKLEIVAYAVQQANMDDAAAAWRAITDSNS